MSFVRFQSAAIEERQQEIIFNFGEKLLKHYIKTDTVHKTVLTTIEINSLVDEYKGNVKTCVDREETEKLIN
jgi:hypothetical protein